MTRNPASVPLTNPEDDTRHGPDSPDAPDAPDATNRAVVPVTGRTHNGSSGRRIDDSLCLIRTAAPSCSSPDPGDTIAYTTTTPPLRFPAGQVQFHANTITPSPPLALTLPPSSPSPESASIAARPDLYANGPFQFQQSPGCDSASPENIRPFEAREAAQSTLRLQTDFQAVAPPATLSAFHQQPDSLNHALTGPSSGYIRPSTLVLQHKGSTSSLKPVSRTPSLKTVGFGTASAASSTVPSPIISAMGDVTPLPSPLLSSDSPGPWKKLGRSPPREVLTMQPFEASASAFATSNGESLTAALAHQTKRKAYADLLAGNPGQPTESSGAQKDVRLTHTRDRSLSEYVPDPMLLPKRMVTVSASHVKPVGGPDHVEVSYETHMRREPHLSEVRGLTPIEKPPTPPPSESSLLFSDGASSSSDQKVRPGKKRSEYFEAHGRDDRKRRRWRAIKLLGQGTFSRVMLATSQISTPEDATPGADDDADSSALSTPEVQAHYDRRTLVAVKVCEHGPKGGASEDRVEMSLKRELEIMQCIHHPSLVRLKAWSIEPTRAILVLSYCPGGDLFDVASAHRNLLAPPLLARMFAELVAAVQYLHGQHIVHRDIKLENVLVNLPPNELTDASINWATYPFSVTTLTDLGLSRRVTDDEKLETRCGSDDYAAPEVIMGQPYDGRATDAWSLGVLLYALLEGRLPFDPSPGMSDAHRMRSRTSHRIARVEWRWIEFAGEDGDHEGNLAKFRASGLVGAMEITEGLLKRARNRWALNKVAATTWVHDAMTVEGGLRFREEEEGEEV